MLQRQPKLLLMETTAATGSVVHPSGWHARCSPLRASPAPRLPSRAAAAGAVADGSSGKLDEAAPGAAGATVGDVALDAVVAVVAADCAP